MNSNRPVYALRRIPTPIGPRKAVTLNDQEYTEPLGECYHQHKLRLTEEWNEVVLYGVVKANRMPHFAKRWVAQINHLLAVTGHKYRYREISSVLAQSQTPSETTVSAETSRKRQATNPQPKPQVTQPQVQTVPSTDLTRLLDVAVKYLERLTEESQQTTATTKEAANSNMDEPTPQTSHTPHTTHTSPESPAKRLRTTQIPNPEVLKQSMDTAKATSNDITDTFNPVFKLLQHMFQNTTQHATHPPQHATTQQPCAEATQQGDTTTATTTMGTTTPGQQREGATPAPVLLTGAQATPATRQVTLLPREMPSYSNAKLLDVSAQVAAKESMATTEQDTEEMIKEAMEGTNEDDHLLDDDQWEEVLGEPSTTDTAKPKTR